MARPTKQGLDYFPYDCNTDRKIKILVRKYGLNGEGFYLNLLKMIYSNGYYYQLCEDLIDDFCIEFGIDQNQFEDMLKFCLNKNLFSKEAFNVYNVLTSNGIQKRFMEATKRRLSMNNVDIYEVNVNNNLINVDNNPQSKVKKSKEEESKEKKENFFFDFLMNLSDFGVSDSLIFEAKNHFESLPKSKVPNWQEATFKRNLKSYREFPIEKIEVTLKKTIDNGWRGLFPENVKKTIVPTPKFDSPEWHYYYDKDLIDAECNWIGEAPVIWK